MMLVYHGHQRNMLYIVSALLLSKRQSIASFRADGGVISSYVGARRRLVRPWR